MKTKIIAFLTIFTALFIAVCSVGLNSASAEEQEPEAMSDGEVYSNNLYTGISYREDLFTDPNGLAKPIHTQNFSGSEENTVLLTNMMSKSDDKDMLISIIYEINDNPFIWNNDSAVISDMTKLYLHDDAYWFIDTLELSTISFAPKYIIRNDDDHTVTVRYVVPAGSYDSTTEYFMIAPKLSHPDGKGRFKYSNGNSVVDMHVSFIEKQSVLNDSLKTINIDYTPYSSGMTWQHPVLDINSNFLSISAADPHEFARYFVNVITVRDESGEKVDDINYDTILNPIADGPQVIGGVYEYIIEVFKDGKSDILLLSITCTDNEAPAIIGANEYNVPSGSLLQVSSIKSTLTAVDNVTSEKDITISMKYDYYTENYREPGTYYVCFVATDKDGNVSDDFVVKINVLDKEAPKFYDQNGRVVSSTKVYKSTDSILVLSDITNNLKAVDSIDGELEITVKSNTYVGNGDKPGQYYISLRAVDSSGNGAVYNITVYVKEEMPNFTILIDGKTIIVDKHVKLVKEDFHTILQVLAKYNPNTSSYTNISDEIYRASYNEVGDYLVDYNIIATNGQETSGVFTIKVIESRTDGAFLDEKEEEPGVIESIFTWLWNLLVSFFEFIGSLFTGGKK